MNSGTKPKVPFLNPEQLMSVRSLNLRVKIIVEGLIAGLHRSPYHGFSSEFLEHRPYQQGDSVRSIDWRAYARTDRAAVRLFEDETNLYARILLDKSASMGFCWGSRMTKLDYARTLAASIAWILIRQRDAVGIMTFDDKAGTCLEPHSTGAQLKNILSTLQNCSPSQGTHCGRALNAAAGVIRKRGLCVVISDLLDEPESVIQGLRHLRFKKQDVMVIAVLDPMETDFRNSAPLLIHDMETGSDVAIDGETAAAFQKNGLSAHFDKISAACRELGIDIETVLTSELFHKALIRILDKRRRLF
jgi:uncharacterized protein (DUF58 family)